MNNISDNLHRVMPPSEFLEKIKGHPEEHLLKLMSKLSLNYKKVSRELDLADSKYLFKVEPLLQLLPSYFIVASMNEEGVVSKEIFNGSIFDITSDIMSRATMCENYINS